MQLLTKSTVPNLVAVALILLGLALPEPVKTVILSVGLFALSGALTNWLAIYMLFDRVPGLYGSGVIPLHFEEFKEGILNLVTRHLFKKEKVDASFATGDGGIDLTGAIEALDLDLAYDQLVEVIMESSFGSMLGMVGGAQALEPMREPFKKRMANFLAETSQSPRFQKAVRNQISNMTGSDEFMARIISIVKDRLDELSPEMVKDIVQEMIRKHLGWLVVWGGVIGGLIGLISALVLQVVS